jgi:thiamine biosynthesis lipoprotein
VTDPHVFRSMGCRVLVSGAGPATVAAIERLFGERDARFSRFSPASELSRMNAAAGSPTVVSPDFARALDAALGLVTATAGLVDPTVGAALLAAGYDRDFGTGLDRAEPAGAPRPGRPADVRLDGRLLLIPRHTVLDLNGVVKAMAVDDAAALLDGGWVSAGGDLACRGPVDVGLPGGGAVRLESGAIATSGSGRRRWLRAGRVQHHLIDARTGAPAVSVWEQVSAAGATCLDADAAARSAFLLSADGPAWLDERGIPGRFVGADGTIVANAAWRRSVERVPACT